MRKFVVAGNWKMHKNPTETRQFVADLQQNLRSYTSTSSDREYVLFAQALCLSELVSSVQGSALRSGAQNCYFEKAGAFTGENSPQTLVDMGVTDILVGHSERRTLFSESDEDTGKKVRLAIELGLRPMLCIGESAQQRQQGKTKEVNLRQLRAGLNQVKPTAKVCIAYEPVWAIGTGAVATPDQAQEAHKEIRIALREMLGEEFSQTTPLLYGGSVKPDNSSDLAKKPDIDGFLVGGASLKTADFTSICITPRK